MPVLPPVPSSKLHHDQPGRPQTSSLLTSLRLWARSSNSSSVLCQSPSPPSSPPWLRSPRSRATPSLPSHRFPPATRDDLLRRAPVPTVSWVAGKYKDFLSQSKNLSGSFKLPKLVPLRCEARAPALPREILRGLSGLARSPGRPGWRWSVSPAERRRRQHEGEPHPLSAGYRNILLSPWQAVAAVLNIKI